MEMRVVTVWQSLPPVSSTSGGLRLRDPLSLTDVRLIHTSTICRDIDQAAKYIGAGAATVGVAGSGTKVNDIMIIIIIINHDVFRVDEVFCITCVRLVSHSGFVS